MVWGRIRIFAIKGGVLPGRASVAAASQGGRQRLQALRNLVETGVAPDHPISAVQAWPGTGRGAGRAGPIARYLPNALTVSRILLAPAIGVLVVRSHGQGDWPAGVLFGITALTDQFDGVLARIWRTESAFGKVVDPLADKLLIGTAIYCLILCHRLPWLALVLPFVRHGLFWTARFLSPRRGMLSPSWPGKLSAWILYTGVGFMIVSRESAWWLLWLFWIGMAMTFMDALRYAFQTPTVQALSPEFSIMLLSFTQRDRTKHG
jgi:CDP-diacylglycerol--glycerol-3-phosphate 3-phosphatidyltransferase